VPEDQESLEASLAMVRRISVWNLTLPVAWLFVGCIASLSWLGIIAYLPLMLPACLLSAVGFPEGSLWVSGHSPPFLNTSGLFVVYFIPAAIGILRWLLQAFGVSYASHENWRP
jgi:hypothetical protein